MLPRKRIIGYLTSLALATTGGLAVNGVVGGGVTAADGGDTGLMRQFVLREIVHAHALPHGVHLDSDAEQHDLGDGAIGGV